jgi:hypothetical protein
MSIPKISVVDGHNDAFFYWMQSKGDEPAIEVLIDKHPDMLDVAPTVSNSRLCRPELNLESAADYNYADKCLSVANYNCAAVYEGLADVVYWFDPRKDYVVVFGHKSGLKTKIMNNNIVWEDGYYNLPYKNMSIKAALKDIAKRNKSVLCNTDLDAYFCSGFPNDNNSIWERLGKMNKAVKEVKFQEAKTAFIKKNTLNIETIIRGLPAERIIANTVAESQTPTQWVPSENVSEFLELTKEIFRKAEAGEKFDLEKMPKPTTFLQKFQLPFFSHRLG